MAGSSAPAVPTSLTLCAVCRAPFYHLKSRLPETLRDELSESDLDALSYAVEWTDWHSGESRTRLRWLGIDEGLFVTATRLQVIVQRVYRPLCRQLTVAGPLRRIKSIASCFRIPVAWTP